MANHLMAAMRWWMSRLWLWPVVGIGAPALYTLGVAAMYANQHIIAAFFYLIALIWLTARAAAEASSHAQKVEVTLSLIAVGALFFCGSLLWIRSVPPPLIPQGSTGSSFPTELFTDLPVRILAYLSGLPWQWIAPSFFIGALSVGTLTFLRERRRRNLICREKWLHQLKENDIESIRDLVRICGILYRPEISADEPPYIDFVFGVFNNSLCEVAISDSIAGYISYGNGQRKFMSEPKMESDPVKQRCPIRGDGHFTVRQWLSKEEADYVSRPSDLLFWFNNLTVMFQGTAKFPEITPTQLYTEHQVRKEKGIWLAYEQLQYLSAFNDEQWAEIASGSAQRELQVASLTTKLEEPQRAIQVSEAEPNIVLCWDDDDNYFRIELDEKKTFHQSSGPGKFNAVVLQFRNEPKPPQKIAKVIDVTARILYYDCDQPNVVDLRTQGCWLDDPSSTISFDVDAARYLVLVMYERGSGGFSFKIFNSGDPNNFMAMSGGGGKMLITTKLTWGEHRECGIEENFELAIEHQEHSSFFELFHLPGKRDDKNQPIKESRGRVYVR